MFAIVNIAGQQLKVQPNQKVFVNRLAAEAGAELTFDQVLLVENDGSISVGAPVVSGASVQAKVLEHVRGEKIIVYKFKRRKDYRKKRGHRQELTRIQISGINV